MHVLTWVVAVLALPPLEHRGRTWIGELLNLTLLQAWPTNYLYGFAANAVSWSLSVEVLFYALFPVLLPLLRRLSSRGLWLLGASMLAAFMVWRVAAPSEAVADLFPPARLPEFLIGAALSLLMQRGWRPPVSLLPAFLLATAAVVAEALPLGPQRYGLWTEVPFALLIVAACRADLDGSSWLDGPVWVRLGQWSFAIFMTHQLILRTFSAVVPHAEVRYAAIPLLLAASLVAASLTFRFVEQPAQRMLRGAPADARAGGGGAPGVR